MIVFCTKTIYTFIKDEKYEVYFDYIGMTNLKLIKDENDDIWYFNYIKKYFMDLEKLSTKKKRKLKLKKIQCYGSNELSQKML